jgi:hypothetical protein
MAHVFVSYRLKPGVTREQYETWSRSTDVPALRSVARVKSIAVYRIEEKLLAEGTPTYQYIELLDVPDLPGFMAKDIPRPVMSDILAQFAGLTDNVEIVSATQLS